MLTSVDQSGPASAGGLMRGDLVVTLDGQPVTGVDDLIRLLNADRIGRTIAVDVIRLGRLRKFEMTPVERKNNTRAR
jgi:S1-C subfamily serine protease